MGKWGKVLGLTVLVAASVAMAAELAKDKPASSGSWRYRMTIEVETPEGLQTGSAVREVTVQQLDGPINPSTAGVDVKVHGEAVTVDLGKRGILFALMRNSMMGPDYAYNIIFHAFPGPPGFTAEGISYYSSLKGAEETLSFDDYPTFIKFRDPKDPTTIELVQDIEIYEEKIPAGGYKKHLSLKADHFENLFGKGVKIKKITIEMTDAPVTKSIEKYLPSFGKDIDFRKWQRSLRYGDPLYLSRSDFAKG